MRVIGNCLLKKVTPRALQIVRQHAVKLLADFLAEVLHRFADFTTALAVCFSPPTICLSSPLRGMSRVSATLLLV